MMDARDSSLFTFAVGDQTEKLLLVVEDFIKHPSENANAYGLEESK